MPVYRSVKVVVENNTNAQMTVEGFECMQGQWTDKTPPSQGAQILRQSSQSYSSESLTLQTGTSAFIRLGSVYGYTKLTWSQPWVGEFQCTAECPQGMHAQWQIDTQCPDAVVAAVVLTK